MTSLRFWKLIFSPLHQESFGCSQCALKQWGGLDNTRHCSYASVSFYFGTAEPESSRVEFTSLRMITQHHHKPLPNPISTWHLWYKVFYVTRGLLHACLDMSGAMEQFSTFLLMIAFWYSHNSHLFTAFHLMVPTQDEPFSGVITGEVHFKIPSQLFCSRAQWSSSLRGDTQFPSSEIQAHNSYLQRETLIPRLASGRTINSSLILLGTMINLYDRERRGKKELFGILSLDDQGSKSEFFQSWLKHLGVNTLTTVHDTSKIQMSTS